MSDSVKIMLVEDTELFRKGLSMVLNKFEKTHVVAEVSNGKDFLNALDDVKPDIVLMDIELPDMSGIKATELALQKYPRLKIIALTMFGEDEYINSMMKAGAKGFLMKNIGKDELKKAIAAVQAGKLFYSDELMSYFYEKGKVSTTATELKQVFSQKELEVLNLIAQGLTDTEIADTLDLSPRTISWHRTNMLVKTGSKNTVNLIIFAVKHNIIEL